MKTSGYDHLSGQIDTAVAVSYRRSGESERDCATIVSGLGGMSASSHHSNGGGSGNKFDGRG